MQEHMYILSWRIWKLEFKKREIQWIEEVLGEPIRVPNTQLEENYLNYIIPKLHEGDLNEYAQKSEQNTSCLESTKDKGRKFC